MKLQLSIVACAMAALFALPTLSNAFSTLGGNLGIGTTGNGYQRDFMIFNNAADATANDNAAADASHPGALGAKQAIWKAGEVWNSNKDGQANFDFDFQGNATSAGGINSNTISWGNSGCSGGTLAYTQTPISDGWTILMCESWVWNDGPSTIGGGQIDIQGVAAHELGHALGLGHSSVSCSGACANYTTMCPFICGTGTDQRSLGADDKSGLTSIYGTKPLNKPLITGISGSFNVGGTLVITGTNFPASVNVKFTAGTTTNTGSIPGTVYGVAATSTSCSVTIPATALDGNVAVWAPGIARLSNEFPIDIGSGGGGGPCGSVTFYGAGSVGSASGTTAVIGSSGGSPSASNPNFKMELTGGNAGQRYWILNSSAQAASPQLWGTLYVKFPFTQTLIGATSGTGTGSASIVITPAMVGATQYFQFLVLDNSSGYQHTGGSAVTFCP